MHNVSHLPYNTEVLTFIAFAHFFVFWIIRNNVNTVFITLKSFYKGCSPVVDGIDSVCTVVAQVIIKNDVVIKKGWLHGVTAYIGCTHVFPVFFQVRRKCNVINYISSIWKFFGWLFASQKSGFSGLRYRFIPSLRFGTGFASPYNPCHGL